MSGVLKSLLGHGNGEACACCRKELCDPMWGGTGDWKNPWRKRLMLVLWGCIKINTKGFWKKNKFICLCCICTAITLHFMLHHAGKDTVPWHPPDSGGNMCPCCWGVCFDSEKKSDRRLRAAYACCGSMILGYFVGPCSGWFLFLPWCNKVQLPESQWCKWHPWSHSLPEKGSGIIIAGFEVAVERCSGAGSWHPAQGWVSCSPSTLGTWCLAPWDPDSRPSLAFLWVLSSCVHGPASIWKTSAMLLCRGFGLEWFFLKGVLPMMTIVSLLYLSDVWFFSSIHRWNHTVLFKWRSSKKTFL